MTSSLCYMVRVIVGMCAIKNNNNTSQIAPNNITLMFFSLIKFFVIYFILWQNLSWVL